MEASNLPMAAIRVLIADDHPLVRSGLRRILESTPIQVVGEAQSGEEVLRRTRDLKPDVVLMDLFMPGMGGLAATSQLKATQPEVAVLVVTAQEDIAYFHRSLQSGAAGYLVKDSSYTELPAAIRKVAAKGRYVDPTVRVRLRQERAGPRAKP
jgi:DNA-binding NarL/FixJ family response regulator